MSALLIWLGCGALTAIAGCLAVLAGWEAYRIRIGAWSLPPERRQLFFTAVVFVESVSRGSIAALLSLLTVPPGGREILAWIMLIVGPVSGVAYLAVLYIGYRWLLQLAWPWRMRCGCGSAARPPP